MKELLTKKFWLDVKKTFDEARAEPVPASAASNAALPARQETGAEAASPPSGSDPESKPQ